MNRISSALLAALLATSLFGCDSETDEHGHEHSSQVEAAGHDHGGGEHSHEGDTAHNHDQPETEAVYGDAADAPAAVDQAEEENGHHEHHDDASEPHDHHDHGDDADDHQH